jgi:16S rRNA (cytosine967-C5)-methyltransferase
LAKSSAQQQHKIYFGSQVNDNSTRLTAIKILQQIMLDKGSLSSLLNKNSSGNENSALLQALCYGFCRHYQQLVFIAAKFLNKPLRKKDQDVYCLILIGVYQLFFMRMPDYAVINESVSCCSSLKKIWAKKLVNAVLRSVQREMEALQSSLETTLELKYSHPAWLISLLQESWPDEYLNILQNNNLQAPMTLRINKSKTTLEEYQSLLETKQIQSKPSSIVKTALILNRPVAVNDLPGFDEGLISVQDEASQLAVSLLNPQNNETILDACAAPGGKSCAILEQASGVSLFAVDNDALRLQRVTENLQRIHADATLIHNDIIEQAMLWQQKQMTFDRILLDVPCSATGVIRRHPDIKLLRKPEDIERLNTLQQNVLQAVWPLLKQSGILLYSTCSVLPSENSEQIKQFVHLTDDAKEVLIKSSWGHQCEYGRQLLPASNSHDGFYYALLQKC